MNYGAHLRHESLNCVNKLTFLTSRDKTYYIIGIGVNG